MLEHKIGPFGNPDFDVVHVRFDRVKLLPLDKTGGTDGVPQGHLFSIVAPGVDNNRVVSVTFPKFDFRTTSDALVRIEMWPASVELPVVGETT